MQKITSRLNLSGSCVFLPAFILILGLVAVWSYFNLDQRVFSLLCQKPVNWDGNFWLKAFTYLGKAWLLIWLLLIWYLSTGRQRPILIALLALVIISLTVIPLKISVKRPRPYEVIKASQKTEKQYDLDGHTSFPSGDTATVFAVATVIMFFVSWPWACILLAACTGIALLRVTAMAHYPSDVFAGAAVGSFAGWLAIQIERRWLPLEPPRFNLSRSMAIWGIIIIPLSIGLFGGSGELPVLLKTYGLLVVCILLAAKAGKYRKIEAIAKLVDSERFDCILNWLRKRRTLSLKIAFPIIIAENIISGKKPSELGFSDFSVMAVLGLILVLAGTFIRFWARGHFEKGSLFTSGPYALVRHPLYFGSMLVVSGILFQLNDWLFNWAVIIPLVVVFYGAAIIYEERSLEKKFGKQWLLYKAKRPAIVPSPKIWLLQRQSRKWSWKAYLSTSERIATPILLSLPLLVELMEDLLFEGVFGIQ